jgi:hypothetical protein
MIDVERVTALQKAAVARWHEGEIDNPCEDSLELVCRQHEFNYRLWHQEDIARSRDVSDAELAQVKRNIDKLNQQRNDMIEQLDHHLIRSLMAARVEPMPGARLNSETPGSVIDRLSILSLRAYHMLEQINRSDVEQSHREKAASRLEIIDRQHHDLSTSLSELLDDIFRGRKRLQVYRQLKMYNDASMNPYLYGAKQRPAA